MNGNRVEILGYFIQEELYNGSRTLVYRAVRENDQKPVVIKLLKNPYPDFNELLKFRNQYTITKNLDIPSIIIPYSLEVYQNGYALVMEDFGGISLREYMETGNIVSIEEILLIFLQITDIIHNLHQNRIIHKDIKPANILINPITKEIKLIDFSIASLLPKEIQEIKNPSSLEGTLAYISPEQTGRMNRGVDFRSDFYALGVTFYELLTGELPFKSDDVMELVHCHIAKQPPAITILHPNPLLSKQKEREISPILSDIVMKLMAKNAEDRYQSALGLKYDLETCLKQLQTTGHIGNFAIAQRDICDRFIIPEKLYGRENEVNELLAAFKRVSQGNTELILVAGFSGIGKTAVVNEIHKPIVKQRGYFIKGKFDQFNRNIPFSAFVQAFRNLIGEILSETDSQLSSWKYDLLQALGDNGQVIIDVIPELEKIIGKQLPAPELSGIAAQNRFNLLFQKFIKVFTTQEHPLVIFLDDLQWADSASLKLIHLLMGESENGYLLLIGAYRDNEVFPAHPLIFTLGEIKKLSVIINTIYLSSLNTESINKLVADALNCSLEIAKPLTEIVYLKTKGNPFFATQFLKSLHQDDLIKFDIDTISWVCDISKVRALAITDDVVEFMANQIQKLPNSTQEILKLAACVGNQFDLNTLAVISQKSQTETNAALWKALQEGIILPQNEIYKFYIGEEKSPHQQQDSLVVNYKFLHDRVQQAAYFLIPKSQKQATHYQLGKLLLDNFSTSERDDKIFDIVNQLNFGVSLIATQTEKSQLARLNLIAGKKAKAATAYSAAFNYFAVGRDLLGIQGWDFNYRLALALYEESAETAYLNTDFETAEQLILLVLQQADTLLDKINIYITQIHSNIAQVKLLEAIKIALKVLKIIDENINLPEQPSQTDFEQALAETQSNLTDKSIADLLHLPKMENPHQLAAMRILAAVAPPAYFAFPALMPLIAMKMVNLSIKFGNDSASSFGYAMYAFLLCGVVNDIESGSQFGQLALNLVDKFNAKDIKSKVLLLAGHFIKPWQESLQTSSSLLTEAYQVGLEAGDLEFAGYSASFYCFDGIFAGKELLNLKTETLAYSNAIAKLKQEHILHQLYISQQMMLNLSNSLNARDCCSQLTGEAYDEIKMAPIHERDNNRTTLACLYLAKLQLSYLFGNYQQARENAFKAKQYLDGVVAMPHIVVFYFYDSLVKLAQFKDVKNIDQSQIQEQLAENQAKISYWADNAPMNCLHKFYLIEAEKCRVLGQRLEAIELYDKAIFGAKENNFIQEEALANELKAKFYLDWGKRREAIGYMQEAYYCYARWGAKAKTDDLETYYPDLLHPIGQEIIQTFNPFDTLTTLAPNISINGSKSINTSSSGSTNYALDFTSILKASQTLSSTIQLDELLSGLTQIILQNSGSERCALILPDRNGEWYVKAIATPEKTELCSQPLENNLNLPIKLINYVKNTQEIVVVNDLDTDLPVIGKYLLERKPKSLVCLPILNQGNLIGILYLKNSSISGVFTSDRILILNFLCTQAAISLENARLYSQEQEKTREIAQKETEYRSIFENVNDGLSICDLETGQIIASNPTYCQMHDYTQEEFMLLAPSDFLHSDDVHLFNEYLEALTAGKKFYTQCIGKRKDGSYFDLEIKAVPFIYKGKSHGLSILRDISEQQAALKEREKAEKTVIEKSQELERALQELKQAQLQMVQNEKMATLGNLVAGVAHEVNNPIGFLKGSIVNAQDYIQDLFAHIECYQENYPDPEEEVNEHAEDIDFEFINEDLPKLLDSMKLATQRITDISNSLRTFSRADTSEKVACNIHEGINSTILILKYRLKANEKRPAIQIIKEYGKLPAVKCFLGQLNQVFMNIIGNAIDALDTVSQEKTSAEMRENPHKITINTEVRDEDNIVIIRIKDNGSGIPASIQSRIFDNLFTTKGVGKGTGLGLAIAKQIIEETHAGQLSCNSVVGEGTEFVIQLPISY